MSFDMINGLCNINESCGANTIAFCTTVTCMDKIVLLLPYAFDSNQMFAFPVTFPAMVAIENIDSVEMNVWSSENKPKKHMILFENDVLIIHLRASIFQQLVIDNDEICR